MMTLMIRGPELKKEREAELRKEAAACPETLCNPLNNISCCNDTYYEPLEGVAAKIL